MRPPELRSSCRHPGHRLPRGASPRRSALRMLERAPLQGSWHAQRPARDRPQRRRAAPAPVAWATRLREDLDGAKVAIVGYAGADVDLRVALREALAGCARAVWLGTPHDDESLRRRFAEPLATGRLSLRFRPDLEFLNWAAARKLTVSTLPTSTPRSWPAAGTTGSVAAVCAQRAAARAGARRLRRRTRLTSTATRFAKTPIARSPPGDEVDVVVAGVRMGRRRVEIDLRLS